MASRGEEPSHGLGLDLELEFEAELGAIGGIVLACQERHLSVEIKLVGRDGDVSTSLT